MDCDAVAEAAIAAKIRCMPTFIMYKDGAEVHKMEGASTDEHLTAFYDKVIPPKPKEEEKKEEEKKNEAAAAK